MSLDLKISKSLITPDPENIEDGEVKSVVKKMLFTSEDTHKKLYEDIKQLYDILAGTKAMQNILNMGSNKITAVTDPTADQEAATKKYVDDSVAGSGDMSYADIRFKVGTFTRDMTLASGNVAYTGVGFQPKAILFFGGEEGSALIYFSDGFTDGTNHRGRGIYTAAGAYVIDAASCILLYEDGSKAQGATLSSFDSDGFTLAWTKTGTPSAATAYVHYLAFR